MFVYGFHFEKSELGLKHWNIKTLSTTLVKIMLGLLSRDLTNSMSI